MHNLLLLQEEGVSEKHNCFYRNNAEALFPDKAHRENRFTRMGGYWDKKGETEIDLIAVNELEKYEEFIEVKHKPSEINRGN